MKKLVSILNEATDPGWVEVTITARDREGMIEKILNCIKSTGNIGHSFTVTIDPDTPEFTKHFGWDGDGSDRIENIVVKKIQSPT